MEILETKTENGVTVVVAAYTAEEKEQMRKAALAEDSSSRIGD